MSNDRRTTLAEISVSFRVVASRTTLEYHHGVGRAHTVTTMGAGGNVASVDERNRMVIREEEEEENAHSATTIVSSSGCTGSLAPSIKN